VTAAAALDFDDIADGGSSGPEQEGAAFTTMDALQ
jgi:hypothetical protein